MQDVWFIRFGYKNTLLRKCIENKTAVLDFDLEEDEIDWCLSEEVSFEELKEYLKEKGWGPQFASMIAKFCKWMDIDDIVISGPYAKDLTDEEEEEQYYAIGKVTSETFIIVPEERTTELDVALPIQRKVEWKEIPKSTLKQIIRPGYQTLSSLNNYLSYEMAVSLFETGKLELIDKFNDKMLDLIEEIKKKFLKLDPYTFEKFVAYLLKNSGWDWVEITSRSNDKGIDITGYSIILPGIYRSACVQVKNRRKIRIKDAQEITEAFKNTEHYYGDMDTMLYVITSGDVMQRARRHFTDSGIILIDGDELARLALAVENIPFYNWFPQDLEE